MIRVATAKWEWVPIAGMSDHERIYVYGRMRAILQSWEGTPYRLHSNNRVLGVDCVNFVCLVLDELFRRLESSQPPKIAGDLAMHDPEKARAGMRELLERYTPWVTVEASQIEPGDVFVTGTKKGGPGHAMIAGPSPHELWHVDGKQVCRTGCSFPVGGVYVLHRVFRSTRKHQWI